MENNEDYSDIISGKFSSGLVNSILNTVRDTPHLKELWPSLQHNQPNKRADIPNFYAIRNQVIKILKLSYISKINISVSF